MLAPQQNLSQLGFGIGLRPVHYADLIQKQPAIDWLELMTEDYLIPAGRPLYYLERLRELYPLVMHGVSLSIGGTDPLNYAYLAQVKQLMGRINPVWISDHLCWTGVQGRQLHDLLPMPYTEEALQHIVARVQRVQDYLGQQILLENVSSYISYQASEYTEWEFLSQVAQQADCLILLDVNNVYVSAFNHGFDPLTYLAHMPAERVRQFHIAGHERHATYIIDTHDHPIAAAVWDLYAKAVAYFPHAATLIERDDHIPPLHELVKELEQAKAIASCVLRGKNEGAA